MLNKGGIIFQRNSILEAPTSQPQKQFYNILLIFRSQDFLQTSTSLKGAITELLTKSSLLTAQDIMGNNPTTANAQVQRIEHIPAQFPQPQDTHHEDIPAHFSSKNIQKMKTEDQNNNPSSSQNLSLQRRDSKLKLPPLSKKTDDLTAPPVLTNTDTATTNPQKHQQPEQKFEPEQIRGPKHNKKPKKNANDLTVDEIIDEKQNTVAVSKTELNPAGNSEGLEGANNKDSMASLRKEKKFRPSRDSSKVALLTVGELPK